MITRHGDKETDQTITGAQTVVTSSYNCSTFKSGTVEIDIRIVDTVSGDTGIGKYIVAFHRYGGNTVILDSADPIISLKTPGTLAGVSVGVTISGVTINTTITGVIGRTIRAVGIFQLITII